MSNSQHPARTKPLDESLGTDAPPGPAFTPAQIQHYLDHVAFPLPLAHARDAHFLRTLHRCQITSIPYENLSLHYNPAHDNSIDPQALYAKFLPDFSPPVPSSGAHEGDGEEKNLPATMTNSSRSSRSSTSNSSSSSSRNSRGRGGFCFETSVFFLHVLRGLGFRAYPTSARIRIRDPFTRVPAGPFVGPRHVVNLVLLDDGSIWSTDVGFGGDGPTSPLLLKKDDKHEEDAPGQVGEEQNPPVVRNLGAQEIRLRRGVFPDAVRADANKVWLYEYRNNTNTTNNNTNHNTNVPGGGGGVHVDDDDDDDDDDAQDAPWNTYYAFGETEASHWDLECANFWVAAHPESFQRKQVLVVKFIRGEDAPSAGTNNNSNNNDNNNNNNNSSTGTGTGTGTGRDSVEVVGKVMLADGVLKENRGGRTRVVKECRTEDERVQVLREYFGVYLTEEERQGIRGFGTELREDK